MSWDEWLLLSSEDRASLVAHYRIEKLIELHYTLKKSEALRGVDWL